jgi:acyl dehydratase
MARRPDQIAPLELATSPERVIAYAELTGDRNPLHLDPDFAARTSFGVPIVHGTIALNLLVEALRRSLGPDWRQDATVEVRFSAPVKVGETIQAGGARSADGGEYMLWVKTAAGVAVISGTLRYSPKS